jgi:hypothetical protein
LYAKEKLQVYETNKIQSSLIPNIKWKRVVIIGLEFKWSSLDALLMP